MSGNKGSKYLTAIRLKQFFQLYAILCYSKPNSLTASENTQICLLLFLIYSFYIQKTSGQINKSRGRVAKFCYLYAVF